MTDNYRDLYIEFPIVISSYVTIFSSKKLSFLKEMQEAEGIFFGEKKEV